ncbi:hypothetical protein, conserved [Eimeria praecox]|uniref:Uncharacterized protein n=1 Tax=Eimeria praecox TaxID=51316 RepID=U6H347_9EIME|nr:hypothetical protein, conserved [Eimeria praecox]
MPEWHNNPPNNATPTAVPTFAPPHLPSVESICARPGSLKIKSSRSAPCLRVFLAALASAAAVAVLVFFCSRVYKSPVVQDLQSRRLASAEDSDGSLDICSNSGDEEEKKDSPDARISNLPGGEEWRSPLKKRLLARAAGRGTGGESRHPQQQEQPHIHQETPAAPLGVYQVQTDPGLEQGALAQLPVRDPMPSAQMRTPIELDAAAGLLNLRPYERAGLHGAPVVRHDVPLDVWELHEELRRVQRQAEELERQLLGKLRHWQKESGNYPQEELLDMHLQKEQHLHGPNLRQWQQQQQQRQSLLQQSDRQQLALVQQQRQQHLMDLMQLQDRQQAMRTQKTEQVMQYMERRQEMQLQERQATLLLERELQHEGRKRKREHDDGPELLEEAEEQQVQSAVLASAYSPEEWIEPGSPRSATPQPTTSHEALQFPAARAAGSSTSKGISMQVNRGSPLAPLAAPSTVSAARVLQNEASAGLATGSAATNAETESGWPFTYPSSATSTTGGESRTVRLLPSLLTGGIFKDAGTEPEAPPGSDLPLSVPTEEITNVRGARDSVPQNILEHPFVHLPRRIVEQPPSGFLVDMKRAVKMPGKRHAVPLLRKAHDLLLMRFLAPSHMKELAEVTEELIRHGMLYQQLDLSQHLTCRALDRLGIRFLLLDSVVSAFMVLGQEPSYEYWKVFTEAISHAVPPPTVRGNCEGRSFFYTVLAQQLSWAIQVLKTGRRPAPEHLLRIKRMLFCSRFSPDRMKTPDFLPWRKDDCSDTDGYASFQ